MCRSILKAARLETKPDRLFLVPGNHDVDRDAINKYYLDHYRCETQEDFHRKVADPVFFPNLMEKFAAFHRFAEEATKTKRYDGKSFHYTETLRLEREGEASAAKIRMLGLNSAILAGYDGDDDRKLALGLFQVKAALDERDEPADLTVAFFHHPFSCHHGFDRVSRNRLVDNADLILFGHKHKPENSPLFNLEQARAKHSDEDVDTSDGYLHSAIHRQIAKRLKGKGGVTDDDILKMVAEELDHFEAGDD